MNLHSMRYCPYCLQEVELREDGSYECRTCDSILRNIDETISEEERDEELNILYGDYSIKRL